MSSLMEHIERSLRREIPVHCTELMRRDEILRYRGEDPAVFMHPLMWVEVTSKTYEERWGRILDYLNERIRERALDAELNVIEATTPEQWKVRLTARAIMRDLEDL